ncbi:magnesium transporter [Candidatus Saccharibacteria bacterium]|nr:magnesium transporter [Candidatus Saccharibacteria bacterium]
MHHKNTNKTEIIHDLSFKPKKRIELFLNLSLAEQADLIHMLSKNVRKNVLANLSEPQLISLLERVDPDEATDLLQLVGPKKRERIIQSLSQSLKDTLGKLLEFDANSAAGLMTLDYIQVEPEQSIKAVAEKVKLHEGRTGRSPVVLVVEGSQLLGTLPSHRLAFGKPEDHITTHVKKTPTISHAADHDDVIDMFRAHPHDKVVVLNDDDTILGVIFSDDVLQLMHEQESASLYDFAGINDEESVMDNTRRKVKFRYKWLIINLGTAFLASATVGLFEETLTQFVLLAVYMPIVAGMGGNAATQTLAVVVRGISLKQIDLKTAGKTLRSEVGAGFYNGIINGVIVALAVIIINRDVRIAIVLALAMVVNLLVAGFFGTMIPLIMTKLKKDPASSATVFITTATDVIGFMTFLGLGKLILR